MPDIDEILQAQLEAIENGQAVDDVLQALPNEAQDLEALIKLASAVRELPHPDLEFEKATAAHQRLLAASQAITRPAPRQRRSQGFPLRWMMTPSFAALAAVFLVALITISAFGVWLAGPPGGRSALVLDVNGRVEAASVQGEADWRPVYSGDRVYSGERIRTYGGSSATLVFYEGSRTMVSSNASLALSNVEGRWGGTLRVAIDQETGRTDHAVVPLRGDKSSYVVQAPGASASVQGTTFSVAVADNGKSHFAVHTGKVQVSNNRSQVLVTAGQATMAQLDETLELPAYTFSVSGQMTSIFNNTWTVEGVTFIIDEQTSIIGEPVIGDDLIVTGRIVAGAYIADSIEVALISQPFAYFTGELQDRAEGEWVVSGQPVLVNADTITASDLQIGDPVIVTFSVLNNGSRLALSIAALDEAAETLPNSATPSPVPGAKPNLVFMREQNDIDTCESNEITIRGELFNTGSSEEDFAANIKLGWLIEKGAEYVENVELVEFAWTRLDGGATVPFLLRVTTSEDFTDASGRDNHILLRVVIEQETNRPDHASARMTVNIQPCRKPTATPEPTETEEPQPEVFATPAPRSTPDFCNGIADHPTGYRLAARNPNATYDEIMHWFCLGYGFGEIDLAYSLLKTYAEDYPDLTIEDIFAMKEPGKAWGQVKKELVEKVNPTEKAPPGQEKDKDKDKPEKEKELPVVPTRKPTPTKKP